MEILRGIRVIDVTMWAFVPSAGGVLAHWGADVIKVENPNAPDPMRLFLGSLSPDGSSAMFKHYNRGKRSVAINLADPGGREVLYKLVEDADVFLTSFLPDTRKKLGIDIADIRAHSPGIIYAKGSGQGPQGPEAGRGGYDGATWWCRGSLADSAMKSAGVEEIPGMTGHGDGMSGLVLAGGICAALLSRERTGTASVVDGSLLGTALWFNAPAIMGSRLEAGGMPPRRRDRSNAPATMNEYRTLDGRFLQLMFLNDPEDDWRDLCVRLGRPELADDARFASSDGRLAHKEEAAASLEKVFSQRTLSEWQSVLAEAKGVWAPVLTAEETIDDVQTVANGFIRRVDYPSDPLYLAIPPVLFDEDGGDIAKAPEFAEHTEEVLAGAGFSAADVGRLRAAGIVR